MSEGGRSALQLDGNHPAEFLDSVEQEVALLDHRLEQESF